MILRHFIGWWTRDRAAVERGNLITNMLSIVSSGEDAGDSIRKILECSSQQFKAQRAVVLEDQKNGKFHGTYAWFENSEGFHPTELMFVQQKGLVDEIIKVCKSNEGRLVIDDTESYRNVNLNLYNLLRSQNVQNIIITPLGNGGNVTGLLALENIPSEKTEEASENITLISYFISELIMIRDEKKRTRVFNYNDPLSGALNRRAFNEFSSFLISGSDPFGLTLVEIKDLDVISSQQGYEAGDRIVTETVRILSDIFGSERVYRLVGSKFAAFGMETDEAYFEDEAKRLVEEANARNISLYVGCAFCNNGTKDMNTVVKYAENHMH